MQVWGEVLMCDTPPTLIIVHVDLVQHFIEGTNIDTTILVLLILFLSNSHVLLTALMYFHVNDV
jgi:hypothetical protein